MESTSQNLSLVLLAAGASQRLGEPKALVRLREEVPSHPLGLLLEAARASFDKEPLIVVGAHADAIRTALPAGTEVVENPAWARGRTGGIRLAHERRPGDDLCIAPVDVPAIPSAVFAALVADWRDAGCPPRGWLAPSYQDSSGRKHFGHPILCGHELLDDLQALGPDTPLKALRDRADSLLDCPVATDAVLDDLDTAADLERIRSRYRS